MVFQVVSQSRRPHGPKPLVLRLDKALLEPSQEHRCSVALPVEDWMEESNTVQATVVYLWYSPGCKAISCR